MRYLFLCTCYSTATVNVWHFAKPFGCFIKQTFHAFGSLRIFLRDIVHDFNQIQSSG